MSITPLLRTEGLSVVFSGFHAVSDCALSVHAGDTLGLIGPNGAGKTTLFNLLAGAIAPTAGTVYFHGADISQQPPHARFREGLVRTFQIPHEFARLTVRENLMMVPMAQAGERFFNNWFARGKVRTDDERARQLADETLDFLALAPLAEEYAGNLSGGQKKLLELGRTMMTDAKLVLLDEPAAGVNRTLLRKLEEKIRHLNEVRGYTFLLIEHDMGMIETLCNRVVCMAEGRILVEGDFDTVRNHPQVLEAYLGEAVAAQHPANTHA